MQKKGQPASREPVELVSCKSPQQAHIRLHQLDCAEGLRPGSAGGRLSERLVCSWLENDGSGGVQGADHLGCLIDASLARQERGEVQTITER